MAGHFTLPKLRPDLVDTAFPSGEPRPKWLPQVKLHSVTRSDPRSIMTAVQHLKTSDPLYYNSLVDNHTKRHLTKRAVKHYLHKCGFLGDDGNVYPTREEQMEANRAYRLLEEREAILRKVEIRERGRLERLKRAARAGDITFTRDGIFETKPCYTCDVYHRVASISSTSQPCPGSLLGKFNHQQLAPIPEQYRIKSKTALKVSTPPGAFLLLHTIYG